MKPPEQRPDTNSPTSLKLIAFDVEDLVILAAHLQDAVGLVGDMAFMPRDKRFVALMNRFDWASGDGQGVRRRAALRVEQVRRVQAQGIDLKAKSSVINLLTATFEPAADPAHAPAGHVLLVCAGGAAIRLDVDCIEMQLEDLGPAWAAKAVPRHDV